MIFKKLIPTSKAIALVLILLFAVQGARATTYYSRANGNWNSNTTWSLTSGGGAVGSGVYPGSSDAVIIERGFTVTANGTYACTSVQVGSPGNQNYGILTFSGATPSLTVSGAVIVGGYGYTARTGTIIFTSGSTLDALSVTLGGTGATPAAGIITMTAGGTLRTGSLAVNTVSGNTWTPGTGTVIKTGTNSLPATIFTSFNNLTINGGVTSLGVATSITGLLTMTSGTLNMANLALTVGALTGSGNLTHSSGTTGARTLTIGSASTSPAAYSGIISNGTATSVAVTKNGTGTLTLSGADTYTGATTINTGTLVLNSVTSYASSTTTVNSPGILELTSTNTTVDNWRLNTILAGNGTINKTGIGWIQTFTNANTFSGTFNVQAGTFGTSYLSSDWTGVTADFNISAGALLDARGQAITVGSLGGAGNVGTTWNTVATVTTGAGNKSGTFSGIISGDGSSGTNNTANPNGSVLSLVKTGTGTQTLSGANTYTGATTITLGELRLNPSADITPNTQIVLNGGKLSTTGITAARTIINSSTLQLNANSSIDLGSNAHSLKFANSNAIAWAGTTLTINGWTGTAGLSGTAGKIFFGAGTGTLTAGQLAKISFTGYSGTPILLGTGELVPPCPVLAITGSPTNHGNSCIGIAATPVTYTITNTGTTATGVSVTSNNSQFVVSGAPTTVTGGGGTATYVVTFTPSGSGSQSATITVASTTSGSNSPTSSLSGTGNPPIGNNSLDFTNGQHGTICGTAPENGNAVLTAPSGTVFINVGFASYGTPTGTCPTFTLGSCHALTSQTVTEGIFLAIIPPVFLQQTLSSEIPAVVQ